MTRHSQVQWNRPEDTERAGQTLGALVQAGDLIGLIGDLGAGKTLFVQGLARGLAVPSEQRVTSPTFTLINEYHGGRVPLFHADLYRLENEREVDEIGIDDLCRANPGVVCVEWSDRFPVLGRDYLQLHITVDANLARQVDVIGTGTRHAALAQAWLDSLNG